MVLKFSHFLDRASEFLSQRKGLLPLLGLLMVIVNLVLQIVPVGWLTTSNLFLHLGIIFAILGFMIAWAL